MLYESLVHPHHHPVHAAVCGRGRVAGALAFKTEFSLIALVGVILLIGIVKKNAIMMIDFALTRQRQQGEPGRARHRRQAIYRACNLRLRPF